jgi:hypothetical protein
MSNEYSWSAAREARIDRAIDRAVRDMMQIDPQPGLRRRVLARLHDSKERQHHVRPWAQLGFGIVATMLVLMAVPGLWYRGSQPAAPRPPAMAIGAPAPAIDVESVIQHATVRGESVSIPGQVTREAIRMPRVTNVFGNRRSDVSAASTDNPSRANARRLAPESLPPLTIVPLSARPIVLAPRVLPAPSRGGK